MKHFDFEYQHSETERRWVNSEVAIEWQKVRSIHGKIPDTQLLEAFMLAHNVSDFDWQRAFS